VASEITHVPASVLDTVGGGTATQEVELSPSPLRSLTGEPPLTSDGKPELLYIGAEYCPYCAAMRWALAVALSRFGTFSPLHGIRSGDIDPDGSHEPDPDTATLTFYKSVYTSKYLTFTPVENKTRAQGPLQPPTAAESALWGKVGNPPDSFPFIDVGNRYSMSVLDDPSVLGGASGNWSTIAAALHDPASPIAQSVDGAANYLTAAICQITHGQPAGVCSSAGVRATDGHL